jgi:hypothetical protein
VRKRNACNACMRMGPHAGANAGRQRHATLATCCDPTHRVSQRRLGPCASAHSDAASRVRCVLGPLCASHCAAVRTSVAARDVAGLHLQRRHACDPLLRRARRRLRRARTCMRGAHTTLGMSARHAYAQPGERARLATAQQPRACSHLSVCGGSSLVKPGRTDCFGGATTAGACVASPALHSFRPPPRRGAPTRLADAAATRAACLILTALGRRAGGTWPARQPAKKTASLHNSRLSWSRRGRC